MRPLLAGVALLLPAVAAAQTPEPEVPTGARAGYDGGFFIESADGRNRFTLEGLLQIHGTFFEPDLGGRESEFDVRRMRLEFGGIIDELYRFLVETKFTSDEVELEEAWIGADLARASDGGPRLMIGRMKEPFSLEEMLPRKHIDFPEFSILNQYAPAEDNGVTLIGGSLTGPVEYGFAFYNGTGGDDLNSDKDVAARFVTRPWSGGGGDLAGLQFGVAGTHGRQEGSLAGAELRTEARVPFLTFQPMSAFDGDRTRLGVEAAWVGGPFALYAEAASIEEEATGTGGDADLRTEVWYVAGSWVLTGEDKTFKGVHPRSPLIRRSGQMTRGRGAWQLAARYSELSLDDDLVGAGLALASAFPERVASYDIGINWYASYNARVKLHFLHTDYAEDIVVGGDRRGSEDALLLQFQLHF